MSTRRCSLLILLGVVLTLGFQGAPPGATRVKYRFEDVRPAGVLDRFQARIHSVLYYGSPPTTHAVTLASEFHKIRVIGELGLYSHEAVVEYRTSQPIANPVWATVVDLNYNIVVRQEFLEPIEDNDP